MPGINGDFQYYAKLEAASAGPERYRLEAIVSATYEF